MLSVTSPPTHLHDFLPPAQAVTAPISASTNTPTAKAFSSKLHDELPAESRFNDLSHLITQDVAWPSSNAVDAQKQVAINYCDVPDLGVKAVYFSPREIEGAKAFATYQQRVNQYNTPGLMKAADAFSKVKFEPAISSFEQAQLARSGKPQVGVVFSEWFQLTAPSLVSVIDLIKSHGCEPVLIMPMADVLLADHSSETAKPQPLEHAQTAHLQALTRLNKQLDGLIALGGPDIDPNIYGQKNTHSVHVNKVRDRFDVNVLLDAVLSQGMYLFAICRSHQLLNATLGGSLIQDMRSAGLSSHSRNQRDYKIADDAAFQLKDSEGNITFSHDVDIHADSDVGKIVGQTPLLTNSFHHQVVVDPGKNLKAVGTVFDPKVDKRTIEMTEAWQITTTQFHPERMLASDSFEKIAGTVCRRAHLFHGHKQQQWKDSQSASEWMQQYDGAKQFLPADHDWLHQHYHRFRA